MTDALLVGALVIALLLMLLVPPVEVAFRLHGIEPLDGQFVVRALFGLIRLRMAFPRPAGPGARDAAAARPQAATAERRARSNVPGVLRRAASRRRAMRLAKDLLRAIRVRELTLRLRVGLGDPADTGRMWALIGPLGLALRGLPRAQVHLEPAFADAVLEFDARGRVMLTPVRVMALAIGFAWSEQASRTWRALRGRHA